MTPRLFIVTRAHTSEFPNPISFAEGATLAVGEAYTARELDVQIGERLTASRRLNG